MWLVALALAVDTARSQIVTVARGETIHVVQAGMGPPVVLVPGLFGSAFGFRRITPLLDSAGYHTIVIEPLGIGGSGRPPEADYSLTAQADRLAAVLDSLGLRQALVVAHSIGGSMALRLAYRRPDLVRGIVSLEGGPAETVTSATFRRSMQFAPWIRVFGGMKLIRWKLHGTLVASSGDPAWVTDSVVQGYTADAARNLDATVLAYVAMSRAHERERLAPRLRDIRCPVLLMVGAVHHEGDIAPDDILLMQRTLHAFVLDSVAGAGHFLQEERPRAVLAAVLRADTAARADADPPSHQDR